MERKMHDSLRKFSEIVFFDAYGYWGIGKIDGDYLEKNFFADVLQQNNNFCYEKPLHYFQKNGFVLFSINSKAFLIKRKEADNWGFDSEIVKTVSNWLDLANYEANEIFFPKKFNPLIIGFDNNFNSFNKIFIAPRKLVE